MNTLNTALWVAGFLLQLALLVLLIVRGTSRTLPIFTALLSFYVLRSLLLFTLFGHVAGQTYSMTADVLTLCDLLFQVALAWELYRAARPGIRPLPQLLGGFTLFVSGALALAWTISRVVHADPRAPIDRGVVFTGILLLALGFDALRRPLLPAAIAVQRGMAVVGGMAVLSQIERAIAALHRNTVTYRGWSYVDAATWMCVLLAWLIALRGTSHGLAARRGLNGANFSPAL